VNSTDDSFKKVPNPDIQKRKSTSKIIRVLLGFFLSKDNSLGAHFLKKNVF
jgi:hypothetical protein